MRENRTCGSEGGEAQSLPYPYRRQRSDLPGALGFWVRRPPGRHRNPPQPPRRLESRRSCAHDGVLSARWKSVRGFYLDPEIEANCVVARRGGEQAKMNYRTAG